MTVTLNNPANAITSGGSTGANPTASVGLTAVNGVATTFLRSDGAPALDQTIAPTWTAAHTFQQAVAATSTDGVVLRTSNTATAGNQKFSPRIRWHGSGWKTDATASAQDVDMIAELQPVQGAANPTMQLVFKWSVNGAAYNATPPLTIIGGYGGADDGIKIGTAYLRDEGSGQLGVNRINYLHAAGISTIGYFGAGSVFGIGDTFFSRVAAANWNLGRDAAANPPVAQTLSVQDASGTDIAGATWTFRGSRGTGTGTPGSLAFQTSTALGTGTTLQTATTRLTISSTKITAALPINLPSYTVAGLPTGADGDLAYASNGRKVGEGAGAGTGSMVCYSNGSWRRLSDETAITA